MTGEIKPLEDQVKGNNVAQIFFPQTICQVRITTWYSFKNENL